MITICFILLCYQLKLGIRFRILYLAIFGGFPVIFFILKCSRTLKHSDRSLEKKNETKLHDELYVVDTP